MKTVQYTGTNYDEVKALCGDKVLAPYFCMGFTMLSLMTEDGFVTVQERWLMTVTASPFIAIV